MYEVVGFREIAAAFDERMIFFTVKLMISCNAYYRDI